MYYHSEAKKTSFRTVYQLLHTERRPHYDGKGVYPLVATSPPGSHPLHINRGTHWSGPVITSSHSQPSLTFGPHHQHTVHHRPSPSITVNMLSPSTRQHRHATHPPSKIRISLHSDEFCCHSSQQGQILKPIETT
jgi:hypothetical protein